MLRQAALPTLRVGHHNPRGARTVRILLTNDDGIGSTALLELRDRLRRDGHEVVVSAPAKPCPGAAASFDFFMPHQVQRDARDAHSWSVDGSPAVATLHGLDLLGREQPFDLVLAGPNNGWSLGQLTLFSGVVGAAQVALHRGVPAIALSMAYAETELGAVAGYVAALVGTLAAAAQRHGGDAAASGATRARILPRGLGLNVNLPRCERLLGVAITRVGDWSPWHLGFVDSMDRFAHPQQPLPAAPGIALLDAALQPDAFAGEATEGRMVLRDVMTLSALNVGTLTDAEAMAVLRTRLADLTLDLGVPA